MGTYTDLINQVDAFIRKYYKNLMLKGILLFGIIFLFSFLIVAGLEFIGRFNSIVRGILFFTFIGLNFAVFLKYLLIPALKLFALGKRIDRYQAAKIIGNFFPEINDRLLNTLQLHDLSKKQTKNISLLQASINQNATQLNTLTFASAIDYSQNKIFLKYFIPILLTAIMIGIAIPNFFSDSSKRLFQYNTVFEIAPDFSFELQNESLTIQEGESLDINLTLIPQPGKAIPDRVYLVSDEGTFLMNKTNTSSAAYTFKNLNSNVDFHFKAGSAQSNTYTIDVLKKSLIGHLAVELDYPDYLNRKNESIDNPGDLIIPEGTQLIWNGLAKNTKQIEVVLPDTNIVFNTSGFKFNHTAVKSEQLFYVLSHQELFTKDTNRYAIEVIKDKHPQIAVTKTKDSIIDQKLYFSGKVSDDYGLNRVVFTYIIEDKSGNKRKENIQVPGITHQESTFSMTFNIKDLDLKLEDRLTYFFTVYDNDGVNGSKSTRSNVFQYVSPSLEELNEERSNEKENTKKDLKELIRESQEFKEELTRLKKEIANSKSNSWQQQKQVEQLQSQQKSLESKIKEMKEKMQNSFENKMKLSPMDEKLQEKQKQLEELLDNVMDDELKDLLKELEEMMKQNENKDMLQKMEDSEMSAEDMERQLDRTMEMLKKMDVEERVEDLQKSLEQLSEKQDNLRDDLKDGLDTQEGKDKQKALNKDFEKLQKDLKEMLDKNSELKRPFSFDDMDKMSNEINEEMQDAEQELGDGNSEDAQESQKNASEKMKESASQLQAQMQQSQQKQDGEDLQAMRALLENLLRLSFNQEQNMLFFKDVDRFDPMFVAYGKEQRAIIDNLKPIKDSLRALADRVPKVSSFISQELKEIEKQYKYIPTHIGEREKRQLNTKQQFAMTGLNNLALFLNESLQEAQQNMKNQQSGKGSCSKPGQGKPGKGQTGDMEGMKEMIKKQLEQMKKGKQPGGSQPGEKPGQKPGQKPGGILPMNAQQAAKMAAQQSALQKKLQELREQMNKDGSGDGNKLNDLIKELEQQEEDLINKNWNADLIQRQQKILTRLLESEKAMQERGLDDQRESKTGKDVDYGNQIDFLEYKKQKEKQIELLRTLDPSFSKYYRDKANLYFLNVN
ncbi:hypothetical protein CW751_01825 [Brumimicrobium salinarum]|uniref:DUF4175 domain-containing protein n=1 Tax=Brumimicrobium salinarum TaxID=2058658 RepID=A0A2I0R6U7_9FLAO|nr:hypothetical protein [Brumimicrobium salinarum]PKR82100.1 hypothetical protein CW751_01825 [Brumimicrobium salinarum]